MAEEKSGATPNQSVNVGRVQAEINSSEKPFLGGMVSPKLNLGGDLVEKGMTPQPLPRIPLDQVAQPAKPASGTSNSGQTSSGDSGGTKAE